MKLFNINDIRLFWTDDKRFINQFDVNKPIYQNQFVEYSKYPSCYKDISFWISDNYVENQFYEMIREIAGNNVENVELVDEYKSESNRISKCYRIK